ncbi:MAG: tRNA (cytidine(34)-2'-O)-methyltransferase [Rickettsiales bacterium]|nr:tRNA (cytidine(34)-2'-O)-methyltransferase [Rickettsiales bacterium]
MKILLYQPDIAGNVGTIMRMSVCFDLELNIIEPCGFPFDENKIMKRSAMDYLDNVKLKRYSSFEEFKENNKDCRVILLTTKSSVPYHTFSFKENDVIMVGRESAGVPEEIHNSVDSRLLIPMKNGARCLNVAISLSIVLGEALRQCKLY